jgi:hypothetical protein
VGSVISALLLWSTHQDKNGGDKADLPLQNADIVQVDFELHLPLHNVIQRSRARRSLSATAKR